MPETLPPQETRSTGFEADAFLRRLEDRLGTTGSLLLIGVLLLLSMCCTVVLVNAIPNSRILKHVFSSASPVDYQPSQLGSGMIDEFTGMVDYYDECVASTVGLGPQADEEHLVARSFLSPDIGSCSQLQSYRRGHYEGMNYWRFWHGYQVFLRPLLFFFQLQQIRFLSFAAFVCLAAFFVCQVARFNASCGLAIVLALLCIPAASQISLFPLMMVWVVPFSLGGWLLLRSPAADERLLRKAAFLAAGMLCCFLNFLTVPLLSLTIPLLALYWKGEFDADSSKLTLRELLVLSALWLTGYAACWASKWILTAILLNGGVVTDQLGAVIRYRLGMGPDPNGSLPRPVSPARSVFKNVRSCWSGCLIVVALAIIRFRPLLSAARSRKRVNIAAVAVPLVLFTMPVAWLLALEEHSILHAWFVSQIYFTSFALLLAMILRTPRSGDYSVRAHRAVSAGMCPSEIASEVELLRPSRQ